MMGPMTPTSWVRVLACPTTEIVTYVLPNGGVLVETIDKATDTVVGQARLR